MKSTLLLLFSLAVFACGNPATQTESTNQQDSASTAVSRMQADSSQNINQDSAAVEKGEIGKKESEEEKEDKD